MKYVYSIIFSALIAVILVSCGSSSQSVSVKNTNINDSLVIKHVYKGQTNENIYSVAHYRSNQWLLAVSDTTLLVLDARDGSFVKNVGRLAKPGVVKVNGGLLFLLDKGQSIIQSILLPSFETSGIIAGGRLNNPVDFTIFASDANKTSYFVSHFGDTAIDVSQKILSGASYFALNQTSEDMGNPPLGVISGPGAIYKPGAIEVDPTMATIAVVEESVYPNNLKFFDFDGSFDPTVKIKINYSGKIPDIDLYYCPEGKGYWLIAQNTELGGKSASVTFVDRLSYEVVGEVYFEDVDEIRSMSLVQSRIGTNIGGMLYIVNAQGKVYGYPWEQIKNTLKLQHFCEMNR
jgi:hypothetical protein